VDDIVPGFEDLELDFPTPEGDVRLGDVKRHIILWKKKYIMFPGSAPRPPTLRNPSPPFPGERRPVMTHEYRGSQQSSREVKPKIRHKGSQRIFISLNR
jgi:hypothetical protein